MVTRDFSGEDVYTVLVNVGGFRHVRTTGDHLILRWDPPDSHETTDPRTVVVPAHDSISIGTLHDIADDAGEDVDPGQPTLSIEGLETFGRVFRATNLELLAAIVEHDPESIRGLARIVDRNPPEVLDNVHELADYGLLELEEEGRAKRPVVPYDEIDVDLPLTTRSGREETANA